MTKTIKLTKSFIQNEKAHCTKGKIFRTYADPPHSEGESFKPDEIRTNPNAVEILDADGNVIRTEAAIVYTCNAGENIEMPTALADGWIAADVMQEVT